jgi:hypothetical protein
MDGPEVDRGLMHRCIELVFQKMDNEKNARVFFQYVQLYNRDWLDLLAPQKHRGLLTIEEVAESGNNNGFLYLRNADVRTASSARTLLRDVEAGGEFRATGKTNMNDASSRSHAILLVFITHLLGGESSSTPEEFDTKRVQKVLHTTGQC